ncbi:type 3 dihydrofolate reductase [soil metagenome]
MQISIIIAYASNGVIGLNNALPWHLPADLKHFQQLTLNKPIIMGRKTYESIGMPLPKRINVVVTRNQQFSVPGVELAHSLEAAFTSHAESEELMVIGGAELLRQALPYAQRLYLTEIHQEFNGDTYLPAIDWQQWREVAREHHKADAKNAYDYSFVTWERL